MLIFQWFARKFGEFIIPCRCLKIIYIMKLENYNFSYMIAISKKSWFKTLKKPSHRLKIN